MQQLILEPAQKDPREPSQQVPDPAASPLSELTDRPQIPRPADLFRQALANRKHDESRVKVTGKAFSRDGSRFDICGVTYGPFGGEDHFTSREIVKRDFGAMQDNGINTIRVYTQPPRWLLDLAESFDLQVMVGLPWEQHVTFLADESLCARIENSVREQVRNVAGHPAIFCYIVGNEITSSIVRWHGAPAVERFIERLCKTVREVDPLPLVTYANFPSTQYLRLPFLDFVSFNVYLNKREDLSRYLASLHHECDDRPLLLTEVGFDNTPRPVEGVPFVAPTPEKILQLEAEQAEVLEWQVRTAFAEGCAGVVLFSWTDEWVAGGADITEWNFGLTRRDRSPKAALHRVALAMAEVPFPAATEWPLVSVVICTHNGVNTLAECLHGVCKLDYPNYETIVVDDGSSKDVASIARQFEVKLVQQDHQGLSAARNEGLRVARGEYVAYLDDDAWPDPLWLKHAVFSLMNSKASGVGGPNLPCRDDGLVAECVAQSPGNPTHIMLTERVAEHIPGCNMVFKKEALLMVKGFDPQFWIAGDDVDVCWRLQEQGLTLGFSPAAFVWHHRRRTVRGYLKQQTNYGKAEAALERNWPHKYNMQGHLAWGGRLYARGPVLSATAGGRKIFYGPWGTAPYQTAHPVPQWFVSVLPTMPDWYFWALFFSIASLLGFLYSPLQMVAVPALLAVLTIKCVAIIRCFVTHLEQSRHSAAAELPFQQRLKMAALTTALHALQPLARFWGRTCGGLTPWRRCDVRPPQRQPLAPKHTHERAIHLPRPTAMGIPRPRTMGFWSEKWNDRVSHLDRLKTSIRETGAAVRCGGGFDQWDLEIRGGVLGAARLWSSVEEHGQGRQLTLIRVAPQFRLLALALVAILFAAAAAAAWFHAILSPILLAVAAVVLVYRCLHESAVAITTVVEVLKHDELLGIPLNLEGRFDIREQVQLIKDNTPLPTLVPAM
jgi:GT2 family glycosyltransferase